MNKDGLTIVWFEVGRVGRNERLCVYVYSSDSDDLNKTHLILEKRLRPFF